MVNTAYHRRSVVAALTGVAFASLAGCLGDDDDNGGDSGDGGDDGGGDAESRADSYLSDNDASGYDDIEDMTGEDEVTVTVGAGDGGTAFDPAGIRVDSGTTVVWEWSGEGGAHNVVPEGDTDFEDFGTEEQTDEEGHTVEDTFDESGAALYVCQPHAAQGMYGAVVVE